MECLWIYPLRSIRTLASDLAIQHLAYREGELQFRVCNIGSMDVSDVGVAVVIDDRYSNHRYVRIPWLKAGEGEDFTMPLDRPVGDHRISVIADPEQMVIEVEERRTNNRMDLDVVTV